MMAPTSPASARATDVLLRSGPLDEPEGVDQMSSTPKRAHRRAERRMPEPIPDTPENIMRAVVNTAPKADDEWRYVQDSDHEG